MQHSAGQQCGRTNNGPLPAGGVQCLHSGPSGRNSLFRGLAVVLLGDAEGTNCCGRGELVGPADLCAFPQQRRPNPRGKGPFAAACPANEGRPQGLVVTRTARSARCYKVQPSAQCLSNEISISSRSRAPPACVSCSFFLLSFVSHGRAPRLSGQCRG